MFIIDTKWEIFSSLKDCSSFETLKRAFECAWSGSSKLCNNTHRYGSNLYLVSYQCQFNSDQEMLIRIFNWRKWLWKLINIHNISICVFVCTYDHQSQTDNNSNKAMPIYIPTSNIKARDEMKWKRSVKSKASNDFGKSKAKYLECWFKTASNRDRAKKGPFVCMILPIRK